MLNYAMLHTNLAFCRFRVCFLSSPFYSFSIINRPIKLPSRMILSMSIITGPKSREILSKITEYDLSNENLPPNAAAIMKIKGLKGIESNVRVLRVSFVGELGYELHIPKESCTDVYNTLMNAGGAYNLKNAGYRSLYSLSSEKGEFCWIFVSFFGSADLKGQCCQ